MASPGKVSSRGHLQGVLKAPKNIPGSRTPGPAAVRPPAANARPSMSPQLLTTFINSSGANEAGSTSAGGRQRNVNALSDMRLRTENVEICLRQTEAELRALKKLISNLTKQNQGQQATIDSLRTGLDTLHTEYAMLNGTVGQLQIAGTLSKVQLAQLDKAKLSLVYVSATVYQRAPH